MPRKKPEPGDYVARALAAWTKQHVTKDPFEKILREGYNNDEATNIVLRAAVNPAMTTVATWAAELVQTSNVDFLDRLIPNFIFPQLKAMGTSYTFGNAGVLKIPVRANTPTLAGAWTGEGAAKPVKKAIVHHRHAVADQAVGHLAPSARRWRPTECRRSRASSARPCRTIPALRSTAT